MRAAGCPHPAKRYAIAGILLAALALGRWLVHSTARPHPLASLEGADGANVAVSRYSEGPVELGEEDASDAIRLLASISANVGRAEHDVETYQFLGDDPGRFHVTLASGETHEATAIWTPTLAYLFVDGLAYPADEPKAVEEAFSSLAAIVERAIPSDDGTSPQK